MIAGFPGETDEDFAATFDFIDALPFTYLHVFSFSARPAPKQRILAPQCRCRHPRPCPCPALRSVSRNPRPSANRKQDEATAPSPSRAVATTWTEALTGELFESTCGRPPPGECLVRNTDRLRSGRARPRRNPQFSKITSANARFPLCVIVSEMFFTPSRAGEFTRDSVQPQRGFAASARASPRYPASARRPPAGSQRLHGRFFGGKSARITLEFSAVALAVRNFGRSVQPLQNRRAVPLNAASIRSISAMISILDFSFAC